MIAIQNIPHLTNPSLAFKLSPLSPHAAVWFDSHQKHKMPLARLIRRLRFHMQKIIYGGRYLGSFGSHGSCAMSVNPDNVHRPIFDRIKRCSLHFTRGHTMSQNNSVQSTTQTPIRLNQNTQRVKLSEFIKQQDQQRGLEPLPIVFQNIPRLTIPSLAFILSVPCNSKDGICSPDNGHNRPLIQWFFLCPPKTQAVSCRLFSVMAGYFRQPLKRLAGSVTGTANLFYSATRCFAALIGGYPLYNGATA